MRRSRAFYLTMVVGGLVLAGHGADRKKPLVPQFQTSDRCLACHNGLMTPSGEDVSIGFLWRASMMANSSRDPYWQAGVRRESGYNAAMSGRGLCLSKVRA